jgi:hypothetical protein
MLTHLSVFPDLVVRRGASPALPPGDPDSATENNADPDPQPCFQYYFMRMLAYPPLCSQISLCGEAPRLHSLQEILCMMRRVLASAYTAAAAADSHFLIKFARDFLRDIRSGFIREKPHPNSLITKSVTMRS